MTTLLWILPGLLLALQAAVPPALTGHWNGRGRILANWTSQSDLEVDLSISADGTVHGSVGDAAVASGVISANRGFERVFVHGDYTISLQLDGTLLAEDGIVRERFDLHVRRVAGELVAFGASSGNDSWPLANRASRIKGTKIQVARFTLHSVY